MLPNKFLLNSPSTFEIYTKMLHLYTRYQAVKQPQFCSLLMVDILCLPVYSTVCSNFQFEIISTNVRGCRYSFSHIQATLNNTMSFISIMGIKTHSIAVLITTCISSVKFIIINKYCYYYCYLPPAHISHSSQQTKGNIRKYS